MQEALQNQHFKKIWEKVIMNRHLEAKSLEEALNRELQEMYCSYIAFDNLYVTGKNFDVPYAHGNAISQILGRPITLENIMLLLPKNFAFWNLYSSIVEINIGNSCQPVTGYNLNWQLTKYLHEQTPETWENIAYFGEKYLI